VLEIRKKRGEKCGIKIFRMKGKLRCAFFAFVVDARLLLVCEEAGENNKYERKREGKIVNKREN